MFPWDLVGTSLARREDKDRRRRFEALSGFFVMFAEEPVAEAFGEDWEAALTCG
jgi:hypothetical protein